MQHTEEGRLFTAIVLEVFKLGGLLATEGDKLTKTLGMTSARWKVLGALAGFDAPMTVSQIAGSMGQTRQGVQRLSDVMVKEGVLAYEDNPNHKTAKLVVLTDKGREVYQELDARQIPWANDNAADLSPEELDIAVRVLEKMGHKLNNSKA